MKLLAQALGNQQEEIKPVASRGVISMEDELTATAELRVIESDLALDSGDAERAYDLKECLEDLAFVASDIRTITPREAALLQIAGDAATSGTDSDGSAVVPSMEDDGPKEGRIRKAIQTIIDVLKNLVKMVVEKLRSFMKKSVDISVNYSDRYEKLKTALSQAKFESGSVTTKFNAIPGYKNKELDQLPIFVHKYAKAVDDFIFVQGELLRGAAAAITNYAAAKNNEGKLAALKELEAVSIKSHALGKLDRYAVPETFSPGNTMQVRLGLSMQLLGGIDFGTSGIKYKVGNIGELSKTNRQLIVGVDTCVVDVIRNVGGDESASTMKVPSQTLLKNLVNELEPLINHITDHSSERTLAGAIHVRADFHENFSKSIIAQMEKLDMNDPDSKILADGVNRAIAKLAVGSSTGYTVLMNNTRNVINMVSSVVKTSIEASSPAKAEEK